MATVVASIGIFLLILAFCPAIKTQPPVHELMEGADIDLSAGRHRDQHEFKINVGAGKQECFYQRISARTNLHFAFEVSISLFSLTGPQRLHYRGPKGFFGGL